MHVHRVAKCIHLFEIFSFGCKLGRLPRLAIQKYSERKKGKIDALEIRPRTETNPKASSGGEVTSEHATAEWSVVENGDSTAVASLVRSIKQKKWMGGEGEGQSCHGRRLPTSKQSSRTNRWKILTPKSGSLIAITILKSWQSPLRLVKINNAKSNNTCMHTSARAHVSTRRISKS